MRIRNVWAAWVCLYLAAPLSLAAQTETTFSAFVTFPVPPNLTYYPSADTYVRQGQAHKNQGDEGVLRIQKGQINRSLIKFDTGAIAADIGERPLVSATLRLYVQSSGSWGSSGQTVALHRMTQDWSEVGATWSSPNDYEVANGSLDGPSWDMGNSASWPFEAVPTASFTQLNGGDVSIDIDVTADVAAWLNGSVANFGWIIKKANETIAGSADYAPRESAGPPQLAIVVDNPPDPAPPTPTPIAVSITAVADTYLKSGSPNQNQGTEQILELKDSGNNRALVQFDLSNIDPNFVPRFQAAKLRMTVAYAANNWGTVGRYVGIHRLNVPWSELGATWDSSNDPNPTNQQAEGDLWTMNTPAQWPFAQYPTSVALQTTGTGVQIEWDVTVDVEAILGGAANYGWLLKKSDESDAGLVDYASRETVVMPELVLEFESFTEIGDFDIRESEEIRQEAHDAITPAQRAAQEEESEALEATYPNLIVSIEPTLGTPRVVGSWSTPLDDVTTGHNDWLARLKNFVALHDELYLLDPSELDSMTVSRNAVDEHTGFRSVILQQTVEDAELFGATFGANFAPDGKLMDVSSTAVPIQSGWEVQSEDIITTQTAVEAAADHLDVVITSSSPPIETHFLYFPLTRLSARPVWAVRLSGTTSFYEVFVDALDSRILFLQDLLIDYGTQAVTYNVFVDSMASDKPYDSPAPGSPSLAYPPSLPLPPLCSGPPAGWTADGQAPGADMNSSVQDNRTRVTFIALDSPGPGTPSLISPAGWINDGQNITEGNNIKAGRQISSGNPYDVTPFTSSSFRDFDSQLNLNLDAQNEAVAYNIDSAIISAFFIGNWAHDRLYQLGFDENWDNFQATNFGNNRLGSADDVAGAGKMKINCTANWLANTAGYVNGLSLILINKYTTPGPGRHPAFDAQTMLHEYMHGVRDRLNINRQRLQSKGMDEGWGDFFSSTLLSDPAVLTMGGGRDAYAWGAYLSYRFNTQQTFIDNYYFGTRRYPYHSFLHIIGDVPCGDFFKNPLTYADIHPAQFSVPASLPISAMIGTPTNPGYKGSDGAAPDEVHNIGEVWCSALWECRAHLMDKHGATLGNEMMLQLTLDSMKLLGSVQYPNMIDARDKVLAADSVRFQSDNWCELWRAFASRGLGVNAHYPDDQATGSVGTIVENYEIPTNVCPQVPTPTPTPNAVSVKNWTLYN